MKIAVVTTFPPDWPVNAAELIDNYRWYCRAHDYDLHMSQTTWHEARHHLNAKLPELLGVAWNYDAILWMDADSVFLRNDLKLESLLEKFLCTDAAAMLIARDWNGLCASNFLIKGSRGAMLLEKWNMEAAPEGEGDQATLGKLIHENQWVRDSVVLAPSSIFGQRETGYRPGDFTIHFGGENKAEPVRLACEAVKLGTVEKMLPSLTTERDEHFSEPYYMRDGYIGGTYYWGKKETSAA